MNFLKQWFSVATCLVWLSMRRQLEMLISFICFMVALPVRCLTGLVIIYVLVDKFSPLYGWTYHQLIFMYGVSYVSDGLASTFASQARKIESAVIRGDFDRFLVRPMGVLFQLLFRFIYLVGLMEVVSGLIVMLYGCFKTGFVFSPSNIIKLVLVIIGATFIRIGFMVIVGSVAFWTKRSATLIWIGEELMRKTTQYPISIYPEIFQALFTFLIPFGFISFYPSSEFFGFGNSFDLPLNFALWTPIIGVLLFAISCRVFEQGLKKYESAGA